MRHFMGFILAVILAAALFFGGGWGIAHAPAITAHRAGLPGSQGMEALAALAAAGLLLGVLLAFRAVSPLATGLPGLGLLAWTALLALHPSRAASLVPLRSMAYGAGFKTMLTTGMLAMLGISMIVPLLVPSRWVRADAAADDEEEDDDSVLPTVSGLLS